VTSSVSAHLFATIGQERHILVGLQALLPQYFDQPTLGLLVVAVNQAEVARRAGVRDGATDDQLEVGLGIHPVPHVAAVQADGNAALQDGQLGPLRRAALDKGHLLLSKLGLGALSHAQDMLAQRRCVRARCDRQHVGEQSGCGSVGHQRCPARLQVQPLRRDVAGDEVAQRRQGGRLSVIPARAAVQPRAGERHVAIKGTEQNGVAALAATAGSARLAAAVPTGPRLGLSLNDPVLDGGKQRLTVREREADVFRPICCFFERGDLLGLAGRAGVVGDLEQDADAHGAPPVGIAEAGGRAFHKSRNGKLKTHPALGSGAILTDKGR